MNFLNLPNPDFRLADHWHRFRVKLKGVTNRLICSPASNRLATGFGPEYGGLLLVSLLFMLNLPLFFTLNTGMDLYGFFTLAPVKAYPLPAILSTVLNLGLAAFGYASYRWLWRRLGVVRGRALGPFTRGVVLSTVPVFIAFAPAIVLTSIGGKATQIAIAGLIAGSLTVTHALKAPDMRLDPAVARYCSILAIAVILMFLALSVGGMLVLFATEQMPASNNLLWRWDYAWEELGYPREEFAQRQRDALTAFTLTGSGFMIVALGGPMLGAIIGWTPEPRNREDPTQTGRQHQDAPEWAAQVLTQLESLSPFVPGEAGYVGVFNGHEVNLTASQYQRLVGGKDELLVDAHLIVDQAAEVVFHQFGGTWTRLPFRVRSSTAGIRSGPFSLLCIYARYPGRRFTNGELTVMLGAELSGRESFNVRDFVSQLQRRRPGIPIGRDNDGTFLDGSVRVCLLDRLRSVCAE